MKFDMLGVNLMKPRGSNFGVWFSRSSNCEVALFSLRVKSADDDSSSAYD